MKKIVCELCNSTEFTKDGGMFVCQGCGTKYSAEEAKAMMKEVEGDATPAVSAGNSQQIENLLTLAENAFGASNNKEAEGYCNKIIELDANCYKAWLIKAKAIGWQSTLSNMRLAEAAHSFCKAIDFAPAEERKALEKEAQDELKQLGLAAISLRKDRFAKSPDDEEYKGFLSDRQALLDALRVLLNDGKLVGIPDGYLEEIATLMNESAVGAYKMATAAWKKIDYPTDKDLQTYLDWMGNIASLLRCAINASDEDDDSDIVRYENLIIVLKDPIGKKSYKKEWSSYQSKYVHVASLSLTTSAINERNKEIKDCEAKIAEIKAAKKAKEEEERKKKHQEYWAAHPEKKAELDGQIEKGSKEISDIQAKISELDTKISECEKHREDDVPSTAECNKLRNKIDELTSRRKSLGLFAGKEKKQLAEEISALDSQVNLLTIKIAEEKKALNEKIDKEIEPLTKEKDELQKKLKAARESVSEAKVLLEELPDLQ